MTEPDRPRTTRRRLLAAASTGSILALGGCGSSDSDDAGGATSGPLATDTTTAQRTLADGTGPTISDVAVSIDDPHTTGSRTLTVTGTVTDDTGLDRVTVSAADARTTRSFDGRTSASVEVDLQVAGDARYAVEISATDTAPGGNTSRETLETRYVAPPSEPVADDRLVGVHYYGWWGRGTHWDGGYRGSPVLGEYDSRDPDVITEHLDWLRNHGVNWLSLSWWGRDSWSDETFRDHLLQSDALGDLRFSILYESTKMLDRPNGWNVDFDEPANRQQLVSDVEYLADHYFAHDNYLTIDDAPVVYFYAAGGFIGDLEGAIREAQQAVDTDLYLIADLPVEPWPPEKADHFRAFDAVSNYSAFYEAAENVDERVPEYSLDEYLDWKLALQDTDVDFVPGLSPGFDKTHNDSEGAEDLPILHRSPDRFQDWSDRVLDFLDPDLNALLLTSFNEWHEYTSLEPDEEFGTDYLEIVRDELANGEGVYRNLDRYATLRFDFDHTVDEYELNPDSDPKFARDLAILVDALELTNPETGWSKRYDIGTRLRHPYVGEGVYDANVEQSWRWFGGQNARAELFVEWSVLSKASAATVTAAAARDGDPIPTTISVDGSEVDAVTFERREMREYRFSLTSGSGG